ncbi:MAG TPA: Ig-like domain-containing protein, partial [Pirellulaceae bacterium]|nr:Ig-like domain-containing protein [Pirellulaceae bacterium]
MLRTLHATAILLAVLSPAFLNSVRSEDDVAAKPPGLGDPGKLLSISIETGRTIDGKFLVSGRDASQQLVITGDYDSGQKRDLSRDVTYTASPDGIVRVDATGNVTPIAEGDATIHVKSPIGADATINVTVTNILHDLPVNFPNQIVPVFTKYGCNSGGCHGKSGGQNGFRLSLLGFEPTEDYEYLVKEGRGRRLFLSAPDRSLLLEKAIAKLPHGGGHRIDADSPAYRLLRRWIEQGVPYGNDDDPTVTHIEVFPNERIMGRE